MPSSTFMLSSVIIFQRLFGEIQNCPGIIQEYFWITKKKLEGCHRKIQRKLKSVQRKPEVSRGFS